MAIANNTDAMRRDFIDSVTRIVIERQEQFSHWQRFLEKRNHADASQYRPGLGPKHRQAI